MRIAICDDEVKICEMLIGKVKKFFPDVEIISYTSGKELLDEKSIPDILLLDIKMPDISGIEAAKELRNRNFYNIIIFITGEEEEVFNSFDVQPFHFLVKPVEDNKLKSVLDNAINMSLINNKFAFLLGARNKAAGEALKKMLDKINKGEPAVIYDMKLLNDPTDKDVPFQEWRRDDLKSSYLTTDQLMDFQTILNNFDTEVGIPTIPYQKKERMVTTEAESRVIDSTSRSIVWYDTLTSSIENIKALYPDLVLDVELRYKEGDQNE